MDNIMSAAVPQRNKIFITLIALALHQNGFTKLLLDLTLVNIIKMHTCTAAVTVRLSAKCNQ